MSLKGHTREIVLGVILVIVAVWLLRPAAPEPGDDAEAVARAVRAEVTGLKAKYEDIDIALLTKDASSYDGGGRNLFDYGVIQPPPPSPEELEARRKAEEERRRLAEQARLEAERLRLEALERQAEADELAAKNPPPAPPPPTTPARRPPPAIDLKYMGMVGAAKDKIAIFLDGNEFLMAKEGEVVKEHFRVMEIGYDTLRMGYTDPYFEDEHRVLHLGE